MTPVFKRVATSIIEMVLPPLPAYCIQDAVVGDVERFAIEGVDDFVRVDADFDFGGAIARGGVEADFAADFFDDGEVGLGEEDCWEGRRIRGIILRSRLRGLLG